MQKKIRVACVGDSITQGAFYTYPKFLQELLGENYEVINYGKGGAAVRNAPEPDGSYFWYDSEQYKQSLASNADIFIIMMGTNDGSDGNFPHINEYFKRDYKAFVSMYTALPHCPKVYLATSPTTYGAHSDLNNVNVHIRRLQLECADELSLPIVDMNTLTAHAHESFPDGLHGNGSGYLIIAEGFYKYIFGGSLCTVTVRTQPGARVQVGDYVKIADAWGVAKTEVTKGEKNVEIILDGYKRLLKRIKVVGDCVVDIPMQEGEHILSANCKASCSSEISNNFASLAFDGDILNTRWESEQPSPQWLCVDLCKTQTVSAVRIYWEAACASKYAIQVSQDGESFADVFVETQGQGGLVQHDFKPVNARFVRLMCLERATIFNYSVYEMQVLSE